MDWNRSFNNVELQTQTAFLSSGLPPRVDLLTRLDPEPGSIENALHHSPEVQCSEAALATVTVAVTALKSIPSFDENVRPQDAAFEIPKGHSTSRTAKCYVSADGRNGVFWWYGIDFVGADAEFWESFAPVFSM